MKLRNILFLCTFMGVLTQAKAQDSLAFWSKMPHEDAVIYIHRSAFDNKYIEGRFSGFSPFFLIYPDTPCNESQAFQLVNELGLETYVKDFNASICLINPIGEKYDKTLDLEVYKDFVNKSWALNNLKVIGIGHGATFINMAVANHAAEIADILLINADPASLASNAIPVPVYVWGKNEQNVAKAHIKNCKADLVSTENQLLIYKNKEEALLKVIVDKTKNLDLKAIFERAWDNLLSKNYRFNNYKHTWYTGAKFEQFGAGEFEPYVMYDQLNVKRNVVVKNLLGTGDFLWYEFFPASTINAPKGTVPLVLLLHGNNNDPRTQAETSGFIELCAKENFVVAELEWQGNEYAPMGIDGIEQVVYFLLKTYPQLDPSRIYTEGLSAGCFVSTALGIKKSYLFAAVGGHSGGVFPDRYAFGFNKESLINEAIQKRGQVKMPYFLATGTDDDAVVFPNENNWKETALFNALQVYQTLNSIDVDTTFNLNNDSIFGIKLHDRKTIFTTKGITLESGKLYQDDLPLIKLVAVMDYGHWNFKPNAKIMWDYFKHFSRDPETKKLIYHP